MAIAPEPSIEVEIMFANSNVLSEVMRKEDAIKSDMMTIHNATEMRRETIPISLVGIQDPMFIKYCSLDI